LAIGALFSSRMRDRSPLLPSAIAKRSTTARMHHGRSVQDDQQRRGRYPSSQGLLEWRGTLVACSGAHQINCALVTLKPGQRIVIDGPCLSACTLLTGIVPRDHVCITNRAVLGFHAAAYYNDVSRSLVPTRAGTRLVMRLYPSEIRAWINRHGGLTPQLITMRGRELATFYRPCH
jgi:hypothetical protein